MLTRLCSIVLILCSIAPAQRRVQAEKKVDFATAMAAATKAFEAGDHATALDMLAKATAAAQKAQRDKIYAAMPDVAGLTKKPRPKEDDADQAQAAAVLGNLAGMAGIEQEYTGEDGASAKIVVTPRSPLVGMMSMLLNNPQLLAASKGQELVEYEGYKAILDTTKENRPKITVFLGEQSTLECSVQNLSVDRLLEIASQENVVKVAAVVLPAGERK